MKKNVITAICILVVIVLLIPIPMRMKDGGTVKYQAVLYSVSDVHRLAPSTEKGAWYKIGIAMENPTDEDIVVVFHVVNAKVRIE